MVILLAILQLNLLDKMRTNFDHDMHTKAMIRAEEMGPQCRALAVLIKRLKFDSHTHKYKINYLKQNRTVLGVVTHAFNPLIPKAGGSL